eukprot:CAMPEP_0201583952 /NCGR_PEP_ID=MMETSP0190_2-20130828/104867_1 /ASSEMBLY_ACC=CAM_ASM_000263 /TAXON_ID=37353 /ORGANISM="Rosalina sp." /LENGTH=35 /DNA_ID= /DNA_START= /DNA_END= /DNA_ORIENTATION=
MARGLGAFSIFHDATYGDFEGGGEFNDILLSREIM